MAWREEQISVGNGCYHQSANKAIQVREFYGMAGKRDQFNATESYVVWRLTNKGTEGNAVGRKAYQCRELYDLRTKKCRIESSTEWRGKEFIEDKKR